MVSDFDLILVGLLNSPLDSVRGLCSFEKLAVCARLRNPPPSLSLRSLRKVVVFDRCKRVSVLLFAISSSVLNMPYTESTESVETLFVWLSSTSFSAFKESFSGRNGNDFRFGSLLTLRFFDFDFPPFCCCCLADTGDLASVTFLLSGVVVLLLSRFLVAVSSVFFLCFDERGVCCVLPIFSHTQIVLLYVQSKVI